MSSLDATLSSWQPRALSLLRIMAGLLFLQHGVSKMFAFPLPYLVKVVPYSPSWFAGIIELVGGFLIVIGLFTRPAAFICAGTMAFAYFMGHAPRGFYPLFNGGNLAVLYCFVFFYLAFAGGGAWSVDATRERKG